MLPVNEQFVELVAKAIGREKLFREANALLQDAVGLKLPDSEAVDERFDREFERLWAGNSVDCEWNRTSCRADALAAINKINLLLLTDLS